MVFEGKSIIVVDFSGAAKGCKLIWMGLQKILIWMGLFFRK